MLFQLQIMRHVASKERRKYNKSCVELSTGKWQKNQKDVAPISGYTFIGT
jgi:hypothetical protein